MKHRSPFLVFLLSMVTFGLYNIYWLADTRDGLVRSTNVKVPSIWILFSPLAVLFLIGIVMGVVSVSLGANDPGSAGEHVTNVISVLGSFVAVLLIIPLQVYWYWKFSKAVGVYTRGHMSAGSSLLLIILLGVIGIAIVQDSLNNATDTIAPYGQVAPPMQPLAGTNSQPMAPMQQPGFQPPMQPLQTMPPQYPQPYPPMAPQPPAYPQAPMPQVDQYGNIVQPPQYPPAAPPQA